MGDSIDTLGDRGEEIDRFLEEWMTRENVPGVSVAVVEDGELVYAKGHGARDLETNAPATPDTLYGIASCTKSFTALAIMQLAERGALDVTDRVSEHVSFPINDEDEPITIHDLLTHSSGLPGDGMAYLLLMRLLGLDTSTPPLSDFDDFYQFISDFESERVSDADDRFFYYNSGYTLLGEIVEAVSGQPYHEYVHENILDPLGMERSTFLESEFEADSDTLTPYLEESDGTLVEHSFPFHELVYAAGGLLSSPRELANYLKLNLQGGTVDGEEIVSAESLERMHQGYVEWDYALSGSENRYGYGWTTKEFFGCDLVSHIGDIVVSSAYLGFIEEEDLGVVVLANRSPEYILQSVGEAIVAALLGRDWRRDVPFFAIRQKLDRIAGDYRAYKGTLTASIERDGAFLRFEADALPMAFPIIPESPDPDDLRFYTIAEEGTKKPIRVEIGERGDVDLYLGRWRLHKVA